MDIDVANYIVSRNAIDTLTENRMKEYLVSIIMVTKNSERFLLSAIDSVLEQHYEPMEIIVVDGDSTDRTAEIAKSVEGVRYFDQPNHGLANARNFAIQVARGDFLAFLDSNDVWAPHKLHTQVEYLIAHSQCEATVTWLTHILEPGYNHVHYAKQRYHEDGLIGYTPSSLVARSQLFTKVGLFDPSFSVGCDADWFARLLDSKLPIAIIPEFLLSKRVHNANLSRDIVRNRKEIMLLLQNSISRKRKIVRNG